MCENKISIALLYFCLYFISADYDNLIFAKRMFIGFILPHLLASMYVCIDVSIVRALKFSKVKQTKQFLIQ